MGKIAQEVRATSGVKTQQVSRVYVFVSYLIGL